MENKKIINWIFNESSNFRVNFVKTTSITKIIPGLFDYACTLQIENCEFQGRGSDFSEETAIIKSFCESVEHFICKKISLKSTNGLAIHPNKYVAKKNALLELIERDNLFCNFLTSNCKRKLKVNDHSIKSKIKDIDLEYYLLGKTNNYIAIEVIANGINFTPSFGLVFGSACKETLSEAVMAAEIEVARDIAFYLDNPQAINSISIEEFNNLEHHTLYDHELVGLNTIYYNILTRNQKKIKIDIFTSDEILNKTSYQEIKLDDIFNNFPFSAIKAENEKLQGFYIGKSSNENLNIKRILSLSSDIKLSQLNTLPHYFN